MKGRLQYYGVDHAQPGEFEWMSQQGINLIMIEVSGHGGGQEYYTAARAHGIKLIVWPIGGGISSTPWVWGGGNNWNISGGLPLLSELANNSDVVLAVLSIHEPGNFGVPLESQKILADKLREYTRNAGHEIDIFSWIDQLVGWQEIIPGQMDWAGIWMHFFNGAGSREQALAQIDADRTYIDANCPDTKLLWAVQTFGTESPHRRMPNYEEIKDFTCEAVAKDKLEAIVYYPWRNPAWYEDTLYNHPELHGVIRDVHDECILEGREAVAILKDGESYTFENLEPGAYLVSGLVPEGWELAQNNFEIVLAEGDRVTVVFQYSELVPQLAAITVTVETTPSGSTQEFELTLSKIG